MAKKGMNMDTRKLIAAEKKRGNAIEFLRPFGSKRPEVERFNEHHPDPNMPRQPNEQREQSDVNISSAESREEERSSI